MKRQRRRLETTLLVASNKCVVLQLTPAEQSEYGRFADTYNCIKTAFHDTDILADILAILARMSARMSVSWNAVFMQLYVSAKRPHPEQSTLPPRVYTVQSLVFRSRSRNDYITIDPRPCRKSQ